MCTSECTRHSPSSPADEVLVAVSSKLRKMRSIEFAKKIYLPQKTCEHTPNYFICSPTHVTWVQWVYSQSNMH